MAFTTPALRYVTGRQANVVALISSRNRAQIRTSGTTMTNKSSVADANWAAGRLTVTERLTSDGTGTGEYVTSTFPTLTAGFYVVEYYDVTTPSDSSPGPTDTPIAGGSYEFYWDGTDDLSTGVTAVDSSVVAGSAAGNGSDIVTLTFTASGNPIADADVWITTDSAGTNVVAGTLQTNDSGEVVFLLDNGEVYFAWLQKSGINPILGSQFTANDD